MKESAAKKAAFFFYISGVFFIFVELELLIGKIYPMYGSHASQAEENRQARRVLSDGNAADKRLDSTSRERIQKKPEIQRRRSKPDALRRIMDVLPEKAIRIPR